MRKTTNYKRYAAGGAVNTTEINILEPKPHQRPIPPDVPETPMHPIAKMIEPPHQLLQDADASNAFQKQIDNLRAAEDMQRRQTRAHQFLNDNPDMRKHHSTLNDAENDAVAAGHKPDTDGYYGHVEKAFLDRRLAAVAAENPAPAKPSKTTVSHGDDHQIDISHDEGRFVSAPVSREGRATGYGGNSSHKITLTQAHKEHARIAGIDEQTYAKQLLRLRKEKAEGGHGGQP